MGALSWRIEEGGTDDADLAGLGAALALRYSDDEPRSPWTFVLYVDRNAAKPQRAALEAIFLGRLGGTPQEQFPWVFKPATLLAVRPAEIEIEHTRHRPWFRVDGRVSVRALDPVAEQGTVTCVIPGHHRDGREFVAEYLEVTEDEPSEASASRAAAGTRRASSIAVDGCRPFVARPGRTCRFRPLTTLSDPDVRAGS